jgi:hypothetical protein
MKKVKDTALEGAIAKIMKKGTASDVVVLLKSLQDSSGLKICQNVDIKDVAYMEVK